MLKHPEPLVGYATDVYALCVLRVALEMARASTLALNKQKRHLQMDVQQ